MGHYYRSTDLNANILKERGKDKTLFNITMVSSLVFVLAKDRNVLNEAMEHTSYPDARLRKSYSTNVECTRRSGYGVVAQF
ncbi:MAG: hypothetical protein NVS4B7_08150 [Ktedonobacteraceae bacterium]